MEAKKHDQPTNQPKNQPTNLERPNRRSAPIVSWRQLLERAHEDGRQFPQKRVQPTCQRANFWIVGPHPHREFVHHLVNAPGHEQWQRTIYQLEAPSTISCANTRKERKKSKARTKHTARFFPAVFFCCFLFFLLSFCTHVLVRWALTSSLRSGPCSVRVLCFEGRRL